MPRAYDIQTSFARGELTPRLHGRLDIEHYRQALKTCSNYYVLRQGILRKREATQYISNVKDSSKAVRLIPFTFSIEQSYVIEFGDLYFRVYANGARVVEPGETITGATQANPVVLTVTNTLTDGDKIFVSGVSGMTEINNREFTVANRTGTTIELSGVDGTGFTAYSAGGTTAKIPEFTTPYLESELFDIQYAQSADILFLGHKNHPPQKITRTSDTLWTIEEIEFEDGPFLPIPSANDVTMTLSDTGNIIPKMTSNTAPSGTVLSDPVSANAYTWADRTLDTGVTLGPAVGSWEYDNIAPDKVCVGYSIRADDNNPQRTPVEWTFEGWNGSAWIVLDSRSQENGWGTGEERFFEFENKTTYEKHRLNWSAVDGGGSTQLTEIMFKESGDTMSPITLTASGTDDINGGVGFLASDVGRQIRLKGTDTIWRWFRIVSRSSATEVTGRLYGKPLRDTSALTTWRLGAWSEETGYPSAVTFFEERLVWARTNQEPQKIWGSKSFDFFDHGESDPLVDDDAFSFEIASDQVNEIEWLVESQDLLIGTSGGIRTLGPSDSSKAFSATNFKQRRNTTVGASNVRPVRVGSVTLFSDRFNESLRELFFSFDINSYVAPELTILSDHLLTPRVVDMDYAESPDRQIYFCTEDGSLGSLTFERDQRIIGITPHPIGGDGFVESVAVIPGTNRSEVWLLIRRTINGGSVRYIERISAEFENTLIEDARYLDSYLEYSGPAVGTITGLHHLESESADIFSNGFAIGSATVTNGSITLPNSATGTNIAVGFGYDARIEQLRFWQNSQDGTLLGRRSNVAEITIDLFETNYLKVGRPGEEVDLIERKAGEPTDEPVPLRTGTFHRAIKGSWDDEGVTSILSDKPLPSTVRSIIRGLDFEP